MLYPAELPARRERRIIEAHFEFLQFFAVSSLSRSRRWTKLPWFEQFRGFEAMGGRVFLSLLCLCISTSAQVAEQRFYRFFPVDEVGSLTIIGIDDAGSRPTQRC